jgi:hypothetical protein
MKFENDRKYDFVVKVKENMLWVSVDGNDKITFKIPDYITKRGYITFWKYHASNSVKFENIKLK